MEKSKVLVILDAGHGSNTPGKRSVDGRLKEWEYCREIVNGIQRRLEAEGVEVYIDHPEDEEIGGQSKDLVLRTTRANQRYNLAKGKGMQAIFVSVHINAAGCSGWQKASGWSVYVAKASSMKSKALAHCLYREAESRGLKGNRSVPADRYWVADFWVLRKTNMPAVLTENMFMDNKGDVNWLLTDEGKYTIIDLHVAGILKYISIL